MIDALLIYPKLGSMDSMITDIPLSIIYAAADSVKQGYSVKAIDLRAEKDNWKSSLKEVLEKGVLLAGISVMTGTPLHYAREVSLFIKNNYPHTKIVWGGPHVTVLPETIEEPYLDFLIRGYGSAALAELISCLKSGKSDYSIIKGLSYKQNGQALHNPRCTEHEMLSFQDIPYHLIDVNSALYRRSYIRKRFFPIFTSRGCPYHCSFCIHPAVYKDISGPKWKPYPDNEVVDHIEYIVNRFKVTHICLIDDTSFVELERMKRIFKLIIQRGIKVVMEFRGARINEIDKMDDDFLRLMVEAGGRTLLVGVESVSDRVLETMQKGITREQIFRVNQKLRRFPQITPYYNFIYGTPFETYNDLLETKDGVLKILRDNPQAYFGFGGDWKPIPGSEMIEAAVKKTGFRLPASIDEWIEMDSSDFKVKIVHPWYTPEHNSLIKLMQVASFVIDDKVIRQTSANKSAGFRILRLFSRIYKPVALLRMKFNFHYFLIEYNIWRLLMRFMPRIKANGALN
ncbi:MAG: hypothetical protein DRP74_03590 [Candidatus Omnitrophota bacterium]|nr:MAG: hypothetical protein DRP74_03590 [Candidatus Omnitrophota bacterium]